jgi:hypothetical protein
VDIEFEKFPGRLYGSLYHGLQDLSKSYCSMGVRSKKSSVFSVSFQSKKFTDRNFRPPKETGKNQKQGEPFAPRTSDYYIKIVKVLSSLTRVFPMCIVALVLTYCAFTGADSG